MIVKTPQPYDLSLREAAEMIGVSKMTLSRWAKAGVIRHFSAPAPAGKQRTQIRFRTSDVEQFMRSYASGNSAPSK